MARLSCEPVSGRACLGGGWPRDGPNAATFHRFRRSVSDGFTPVLSAENASGGPPPYLWSHDRPASRVWWRATPGRSTISRYSVRIPRTASYAISRCRAPQPVIACSIRRQASPSVRHLLHRTESALGSDAGCISVGRARSAARHGRRLARPCPGSGRRPCWCPLGGRHHGDGQITKPLRAGSGRRPTRDRRSTSPADMSRRRPMERMVGPTRTDDRVVRLEIGTAAPGSCKAEFTRCRRGAMAGRAWHGCRQRRRRLAEHGGHDQLASFDRRRAGS